MRYLFGSKFSVTKRHTLNYKLLPSLADSVETSMVDFVNTDSMMLYHGLYLQDLQEKLAKAGEAEKDLLETNERLENHIRDLESRKRAPLYQKKQEEELRAVTEKAQEAETRAHEAETRFKEAKVWSQYPVCTTSVLESYSYNFSMINSCFLYWSAQAQRMAASLCISPSSFRRCSSPPSALSWSVCTKLASSSSLILVGSTNFCVSYSGRETGG